jgi:hypothetical protein
MKNLLFCKIAAKQRRNGSSAFLCGRFAAWGYEVGGGTAAALSSSSHLKA